MENRIVLNKPVNLENLSVEEFKSFVNSFDHVFSDCDGVIWSGGVPLPKVGEFFKILKNCGKTVHFVSNNSLRTNDNYKKLFDASEIEDGVNNLTYPSIAISEYLKSVNFNKYAYCVSCKQTISMMESYGIQCKFGPHLGSENLRDYIKYLEDDPDIGAVVFDSDVQVNLSKLYKSIAYLKRPEVIFINGASDKVIPMRSGLLALGTGVFTDIVEQEVNRKPIQLGKPGKEFGDFAMKRAGVSDPSRVLFIGDMIEQDVGLGKASGFQTLLLLTSCTEKNMSESELIPDYYASNLEKLVQKLQELL